MICMCNVFPAGDVALPCRYYYRRRPCTYVVSSIVVSLVVLLVIILSVRYTASDYTADDGLQYAPTDTRIIPVSNALCQGLQLRITDTQPGYTATLTMLNSRPQLTGHEMFSFTEELPQFSYDYEYYYYYFYMYPGSTFTVSACLSSGSNANFYLIKGNSRFRSWQNDFFRPKDRFQFGACPSGNVTHTYHVNKEDYYYLILYSTTYSDQARTYMSFSRTRYEDSNGTYSDRCTLSTSELSPTCSIGVPVSGKTAYLTITPDEDTVIDWANDRISLNTSCSPRVWMYFMITLLIVAGLAAVLVPLVICIILRLRKGNKSTTTSATTASAPAETDSAPLVAPPPPSNPDFEPPPDYGSKFNAPPAYKP